MTLIYDFDGTLTPYKDPQLPILSQAGSIAEFYSILKEQDDFMHDYCPTLKKYLNERGFSYNLENICYNANTIKLNPGVLEFLSYFHNNQDKQFIITASYEEYIKKTLVANFCDGIYGTILDELQDEVMMPEKKIRVIAELIEQYNLNPEEIIYIGDGFTDRFAFEYVKQRGGKSIFVYDENDSKDKQTLTNLQDLKLIDVDFPKDFNLNGPIFSYITNLNKRI